MTFEESKTQFLESIGEDLNNPLPNVQLSQEQQDVVIKIVDWFKNQTQFKKILTVGGYAGTGKTTIIKHIAYHLSKYNIIYCAYTGKAAQVLQSKLGQEVTTIHKQIYIPKVSEEEIEVKEKIYKGNQVMYEMYKAGANKGKYKLDEYGYKIPITTTSKKIKKVVKGWDKRESIDADLIIIDEASMVSKNILDDLMKYNVPILAMGDHGQLPPVMSNFNLMDKPELKLEKIFRQAEGSPIIEVAHKVRNGDKILPGKFNGSDEVVKYGKEYSGVFIKKISETILQGDTLILAAFNHKRIRINKEIRAHLGYPEELQEGEIIICLHNRNDLQIYNGMMFRVEKIKKIEKEYYLVDISDLSNPELVYEDLKISRDQFNEKRTLSELRGDFLLFDYGYCLTVHKSQGSESEKVLLFEPHPFQLANIGINYKRWLYTGITRARKKLVMIQDYA